VLWLPVLRLCLEVKLRHKLPFLMCRPLPPVGVVGGKPPSTTAPSGGFTGGITDKPTTTATDRPQEDTKIVEKADTTGGTDSTTGTSKYKPELFIYGGQYPDALSRSLGTNLQAPAPTSTTGLTSYRAPGEIEGESGLDRENVWNEASLRLKDALGL